ncbi:MAG: hypothetical protein EU529_03515 [Promethearchaeota archaeon]|nr:MAG: hypothetical protein EU529_03515 [Candidatus Lokiarchaeota archaeon]
MASFDVIIIGAGIAGSSFALKISKYAKTLLLEAKDEKDLPVTTNIFPEHNKRFLSEVDYSDRSLFPCIHYKINYMDKKYNGIIDSNEFGEPFGYISHSENIIKYMLQKCEEQGGIIKYNEKVSKIIKSSENIEVITSKGQSYSGKLLAIATGSHSFELQKSLGFNAPDSYIGICTHLYGDDDTLKENMEWNYIFHINRNISQNGPLFFNKGRERLFLGFLGNPKEDSADMVNKLERILNNYQPIQPFIRNLKRDPKTFVGKISKHPIKILSNDRTLILGEAGGLVTAFFYEGFLGGLASADIATSVLKPLLDANSNFTRAELMKYDQEVYRILVNKYFKTNLASEYLFYLGGSKIKLLWETYCKLVKENQTLRKYIWEAIRRQDLENHDLNRDRWTGEQIFKMLPLLSKATYWPHFIATLKK